MRPAVTADCDYVTVQSEKTTAGTLNNTVRINFSNASTPGLILGRDLLC